MNNKEEEKVVQSLRMCYKRAQVFKDSCLQMVLRGMD